MHLTECVCDVMPYSEEYKAKTGIPIAQVATGYTNAHGQSFILIVNEALWMPEMPHSLVNPNQMRHHGIDVQDNPYSDLPLCMSHLDDEITICFQIKGIIIYFDTWSPTEKDLAQLQHIVITSPTPWDPDSINLPSNSNAEIAELEGTMVASVQL